MRKRAWIAVVVVCMGALGLWVLFQYGREPEYGGKSLSYWLEAYRPSDVLISVSAEQRQAASNAVWQIGTNAVPFLVKWLREEEPVGKQKMKAAVMPLLARVRYYFKAEVVAARRNKGFTIRSRELPCQVLRSFERRRVQRLLNW